MLSGNCLRQTVRTHRASVQQAVKLVAALLMVARVTAGLAESNGSLHHLQADCREPGSALEPSVGYLFYSVRAGMMLRVERAATCVAAVGGVQVKVMHQQLILFQNAVAAYFSGNQTALDGTVQQFSVPRRSSSDDH